MALGAFCAILVSQGGIGSGSGNFYTSSGLIAPEVS